MMNYQALSAQRYVDEVISLITAVEGFESRAVKPSETDKAITIGFGYTFNRNNNFAIWQAAGISLSDSDSALLGQIDAAVTVSQKNNLASGFSRIVSRPEAESLLRFTYQAYEAPANSLGMPSSWEKVALVALTYNRGVRAVIQSMQAFNQAVAHANRAEAWFQMRYMSWGTNVGNEAGLRKARLLQAELFGLYDNSSSVSATEARNVYSMLSRNRDDILRLESLWGVPPDGTAARRNLVNEANATPSYFATAERETTAGSASSVRDRRRSAKIFVKQIDNKLGSNA